MAGDGVWGWRHLGVTYVPVRDGYMVLGLEAGQALCEC